MPGRIGVRLLLVNLVVLLVPVAGVEFARIHERQLLEALERDMRDQAALARAIVEARLASGGALDDPETEEALTSAARTTRTRLRILDARANVVLDSHASGPPEGPEPPPPRILGHGTKSGDIPIAEMAPDPLDPKRWSEIPDRVEVRSALSGAPATYTRFRARDPGVFLFVAVPIRAPADDRVVGVVYAVRSTRPVMVELYRIRASLVRVLVVASCGTALVTLLLAWSISRPLGRLARAAKRVADGERQVVVPVEGGGEIAALGSAFARMNERLEARLRYFEGFAADVAHEFKSPLTAIRGAAELLSEGAAEDPAARSRFLANIEADVARLDRLVSRLLQLSRLEASREVMGAVEVGPLLTRVTERAGAGKVTLKDHAPARWIAGREADLEMALWNLVENALRFSPPDAPVEIEARGSAKLLVVEVRDHGPGVPHALADRIFERFFTTDAERKGTGLGLALVDTVARAHGGTISVTDAPPTGAAFVLSLPVGAKS